MAAIDVARTIARSESDVLAHQDVNVDQIARDLALGPQAALLVGQLGTPVTVPGAPTAPVATVVDTTNVSVAFVAPASDGGAGINTYTVTSTPGGFVAQDSHSPIVVTAAFVVGTGYTFTVVATNEIGAGAASAASVVKTPNP